MLDIGTNIPKLNDEIIVCGRAYDPSPFAAHTFYEKDHPYILKGPGVELHLESCEFTAIDERTVRVKNSKLIKTPKYYIKLEGARKILYRSFVIAGIRDPLLINKLDDVEKAVVDGVREYFIAIGDSFGDASRNQENQMKYGITTDFNKGASWSTDDTEFALLTAKILIDSKGEFTSEDVVNAWLENVAVQDDFPRGGSSEIEGARNIKRGIMPPYSGMYNSYYNSDGSAMRISPIGIVCAGNPKKAAELAEIDASISHYREGIWGAQAVAAAVSVAMVDGTIDEIINAAISVIPKDSWLYYTMNKSLDIIEKQQGDFFNSWMVLHDELWTSYKAIVPEAVAGAFAVLKLVNKDFKTGVIAAGNFGRDADTIGAIVGAILGAKYGAKNIPEKWIEKTRYPSGTCLSFTKGLDIRELGQNLADLIK